jgi:hypothetical protein
LNTDLALLGQSRGHGGAASRMVPLVTGRPPRLRTTHTLTSKSKRATQKLQKYRKDGASEKKHALILSRKSIAYRGRVLLHAENSAV